jgi:hypothetical protein
MSTVLERAQVATTPSDLSGLVDQSGNHARGLLEER